MIQLRVNNFGIHNMRSDNSMLCTYHGGIARKAENQVDTFLLHYIMKYVPDTEQLLNLISDDTACPSKNHIMIRFFKALVDIK